MGKITADLLRRRAEHNEGCLSNLKEITLHQFEIDTIELVGDLCRELQILYLQNNLITKLGMFFVTTIILLTLFKKIYTI